MDANLTSAERNLVQTSVQGNFGSERIAQELRAQWPEEDLKDHDQALEQLAGRHRGGHQLRVRSGVHQKRAGMTG